MRPSLRETKSFKSNGYLYDNCGMNNTLLNTKSCKLILL